MNADQIKRKMAENSRKWHTAKSQSERDKLHRDNVNLSKKLDGAKYDRDSGKWSVLKYDRGSRGSSGGKKEEVKRLLERESYPSHGSRDYRDWQSDLKKRFEENMRRRNEEDYSANQEWIAEQRRIAAELNQEARFNRTLQDLESRVDRTLQSSSSDSMGRLLKYAIAGLVGIVALDKILD